jgi:hypothetical protein
MVQFSLPHNKSGRPTVLCSFILFFYLLWTKHISGWYVVFEWSGKTYSLSGNSEKFSLCVQSESSLELPNGLILSGFRITVRCSFIIVSKKHFWPCLSPPSFDHHNTRVWSRKLTTMFPTVFCHFYLLGYHIF